MRRWWIVYVPFEWIVSGKYLVWSHLNTLLRLLITNLRGALFPDGFSLLDESLEMGHRFGLLVTIEGKLPIMLCR